MHVSIIKIWFWGIFTEPCTLHWTMEQDSIHNSLTKSSAKASDLNWFSNVTYLSLLSVCPFWPNLVRLLGAVNVRSKRKIRIPLSKEEIRQKGPKISHKRPLRPRLSSTKDTPSKIFLQSHILFHCFRLFAYFSITYFAKFCMLLAF